MSTEIERKFLLSNDTWRKQVHSSFKIQQGYLNTSPERTVRIRTQNHSAFLTVKGKNKGISRKEFEYEIPLNDAQELLQLCEAYLIEKTRHLLVINNKTWEIDEFHGVNEGLLVAEIELSSEDEELELPPFIGKEVSSEVKYYNASLIHLPFSRW